MPGWVGMGRVGGCPAWAGRGLGIASTIVDWVRNGTGIYTGLGWGSGVLVGVPLGWKGSWDSPGHLLKGSGTALGFTTGWVEVGWVGGHSPWAE